ncbi:MAG: tyrosine recombinase XerC [Oscillospiraceae bacterium]|nr:tyrosine recombinase XerC [Oscillospiraceae bacterium]
MDRSDAPQILRDFLIYHETIRGHSKATVDEYYLDLRTFFRFLKLSRGLVPRTAEFEEISISDVDVPFVAAVTLTEVYDFLAYLARDRIKQPNCQEPEYGLSAASRARKIAAIRSFFKYLTVKAKVLNENPVQDLDSPKIPKTLPRYLTLEESQRLLSVVEGKNRERDYCILCIFLNCGLRISEIVGLNVSDYRGESLRVVGKGNKERTVYLNDACRNAIDRYLEVRKLLAPPRVTAMFLSNRRARISCDSIQVMVKKNLTKAGLDASLYSAHKLRHTAATLMLQNGVDVRTLQEVLGHENLNTTQIYTHIDNAELRTAADANPLSSFSPSLSHDDSDEP